MLNRLESLTLDTRGPDLELLVIQTAASLLVACQTRTPSLPGAPMLVDATQDRLLDYRRRLDSSDCVNLLQAQAALLYDMVRLCLGAESYDYLLPRAGDRRLIADALAAYQAYKTRSHQLRVAEMVKLQGESARVWGRETEFVKKDWTDHNAGFLAQVAPSETPA